ncbi:MAG TPA: tryptophan synthase subunit alpha [Acidimicrobiales bacterium]|nr:tryptophan synthase subunit alpha [Acidimicrobiales bacterium]
MSVPLGSALAAKRAAGRGLLVAYVMAGSTPGWLETAEALVAAGVDALEVGLPFSDPVLDGPVIQAAATRALAAGTTVSTVVAELASRAFDVPLVAMTYTNVALVHGYERTAGQLAGAGVTGAILADLPLEELGAWWAAAHDRAIETVLLAAPSTPPARLDALAASSEGFLYAMGRMATTGETDRLDERGVELVRALRGRTELPILLGVGVSSPAHAARACEVADGVVVGTAIVRRMLDGATPEAVATFVATLRDAVDATTVS